MMTHEAPQAQLPPAKNGAANGGGDVLDDGMLSTEEVADLLGVDSSTLRRWRTAEPPAGPPFVPISERVTKYCKRDVREWLMVRRVPTTGPVRSAAGQ